MIFDFLIKIFNPQKYARRQLKASGDAHNRLALEVSQGVTEERAKEIAGIQKALEQQRYNIRKKVKFI